MSEELTTVRELALRALARGWIDGEELWEMAVRAQRDSEPAARAELLSRLAPAQRQLIGGAAGPGPVALASPGGLARTLPRTGGTGAAPGLAAGSGELPGFRYTLGEELGRGGSGCVVAALDSQVRRMVALKTLQSGTAASRDEVYRFLRESQIAGQLEHPGIVPVYDLGSLPDGRLYYTMRIVERRSLRGVVDRPPPRAGWPLARLCAVFVDVCRALAYAHSRGVVHRDLKPENILLGDYGEVYVIDWGIAKLSSESELPIAIDAAHGAAGQTAVGTLLGTPGYMAPEQTCDGSGVDHRADLFSLGAILYEILTGVPAFSGAHLLAIITATRKQQPRRPRELFPACPVVLEDLCLALLDKDPAARPASAKAVADEVQGFLDGAKESERRAEEAGKLIAAARAPVDRYRALAVLREQLAHRAKTLLRDVEPWAPIEHKRAGWTIEDQAREAAAEQARALAAAIELYTKALGYDPAAHAARAGLADLYWEQARQAEVERRTPDQVYYDALVKDYDDGRYAALLAAAGRLSLTTAPVAAEVVAYRYVESDRVLRAVEPVFLGTSPLAEAALPAGSYVLVVAAPGRRTVRYPLVCRRGERERVHIQLYPEAEVGAAFEQVAAGPVTLGGDAAAFDPLPRQAVQVADFALARFPVTWGEYVEFLNFLEARDPAEASRRLPRDETGDGLFVERDRGGRWRPRHELLVEGAGRQFCPPERIAELPVFSVTWFDAVAYCAYRSQRDGLVYELPGEAQWEKAARGADGRFFPWGDHFDATFAKMRESRPGLCQPEPVGSFATDESPYGIRDLAGGMRTWVADIHGELSREAARAEPEPEAGTARDASGLRIARGGAWAVVSQSCRSASRSRLFALNANAAIGLRLARRLG